MKANKLSERAYESPRAKSAARTPFGKGGADARGTAEITLSCFLFVLLSVLLSVPLEELEDAEIVPSSDSTDSSGCFLFKALSFMGAAAAADDESPVSPSGSRSA